MSSEHALKIGVIKFSSIGDVVLSTVVLDILEQLDLPVEISWLGSNPSLELISKSFPQVKTIQFDKNLSAAHYIKLLKNQDLIIDLQSNLRSRFITNGLRMRYQIPIKTYNKNIYARRKLVLASYLFGRKRQLALASTKAPSLQFQNMAGCLIDALQPFLSRMQSGLLTKIDFTPKLKQVASGQEEPWRNDLKIGTWIAIAPGASYENKQPPKSLFVRILHELRKLHGDSKSINLLFVGDSKDQKTAEILIDRLDWQGLVLNLCGKLSLWESAMAVESTACVLTSDSSMSHIGEALNVPACVLFGPTVEGFGFSPHLPDSRAFSVGIGCRPCSLHGKKPCRYQDRLCFDQISEQSVAEHMITLITRKRSNEAPA